MRSRMYAYLWKDACVTSSMPSNCEMKSSKMSRSVSFSASMSYGYSGA